MCQAGGMMMNEKDKKFPKIKKSINDFINDEDGSATRSKLISVGSMVLLMTIFAGIDAYAAHSSHKSHSSHSSTSYIRGHVSHTSHTSHTSSSHSNHSSHSDHGSHSNHSNHASHTSHSNTSSHSNSLYSAEGDVTYGPDVSDIPGIETPQNTEGYAKITINDKISITAPTVSDEVNAAKPNDINDVDLTESYND